MRNFFTSSWLRVVSGIFTNLAAAYLAFLVVAPTLSETADYRLLISNLALAMLCTVIAVKLDEKTL